MSDAFATTVWARSFVDELARTGVREVALAPGSRSTPLVLAFAEDGRFRLRVHLDERSAAFFALGVGKASGVPAVVLTTSGTAAANVFPAVVEAGEGEAPLLVLTADRPPRLRGADANQTIDQVRLYGQYTRDFFEAPPPVMEGPALRYLRAMADRAVASSKGPSAGPVHVNFPFDKPLEPLEPPDDFAREHPMAFGGRSGGVPFVDVSRGRREASTKQLDVLAAAASSDGGVIVAGPCPSPERLGPAVRALAARTGMPVLADPLSGARYGPPNEAHVVAAYDLFLRDEAAVEWLKPTSILRVGASPTSAALLGWMLHHQGVPHIVVDDGERWKDHSATATSYLRADAADTLVALGDRMKRCVSDEWTRRWCLAERATLDAVSSADGEPHEGDVWAAVCSAAPEGATVFVSGSMPVRDMDAFGHPRDRLLYVTGNRGASGIDGIVSTAFGVASQRSGPTICVLGDVALFHDQNGLLWSREEDAAVVFVLIDNDGGGIFHSLPIAQHEPYFTKYFAAPHGLDLRHTVEMHGVQLEDVAISHLHQSLADTLAAGRSTVLRVRTERASNQQRHAQVLARVSRSVRDALG